MGAPDVTSVIFKTASSPLDRKQRLSKQQQIKMSTASPKHTENKVGLLVLPRQLSTQESMANILMQKLSI